ncbi:MAG: hypothetical protein WCK28_00100 [Burkholderiales bacterium]|jgi:shikimate 5-dehydrogenase
MDDVMVREVLLGRRTLVVAEQPFKKLKKLLPRMNTVSRAMARGDMGEQVLDEMLAIVVECAGADLAEMQDAPVKAMELVSAFMVVADVCGLAPAEGPADPNASAARGSTGTTSTPSSPLQPAGPGTSSTS